MFQIVNGYVCQTCCDVTAAKAGKDPAHPNQPAGQTSSTNTTDKPGPKPAVSFGGALAKVDTNGQAASPNTTPSSSQPYTAGSMVSVTA